MKKPVEYLEAYAKFFDSLINKWHSLNHEQRVKLYEEFDRLFLKKSIK